MVKKNKVKTSIRTAVERTAYHEAGHTVVGFFFSPLSVRRVTIRPDRDCLGRTIGTLLARLKHPDVDVSDRMSGRIQREIITLLAGAQAERRLAPKARVTGSADDFSKAVNLASYVTGSNEQVQAYIDFLQVCARDAVKTRWSEIQRVAKALLKQTTLQGPELRAMCTQLKERQ